MRRFMLMLPRCAALLMLAAALLTLPAAPAFAQLNMTADQVVTFIKSSIQLHHDDRHVAEYVKKIKLSDRLDDRRVEELQGLGAGPKTIAALRALSTSSASLPAPPPAPPPPPPAPVIPPPPPEEVSRILHDMIDNARNYAKTLPDYLCIQVTHRHWDPTGREDWRNYDTVQEQVSYVGHKENYLVTMVNGQSVANVDHQRLGGSTLSGDFGSIYSEIFDTETATEFNWDHWARLNRGGKLRTMYVFAFHVPQSRSKFSIYDGESRRTIIAGYHGLIYADVDTKLVMRYKFECEDMPSDFPVKGVALDVNYDFINVGGERYVLPLKTDLKSTAATSRGKYMAWNEAEFHLYRKFGTESSITFDTSSDPIPDDVNKEQPAAPDTKKPATPDKKPATPDNKKQRP